MKLDKGWMDKEILYLESPEECGTSAIWNFLGYSDFFLKNLNKQPNC